MLKLSDLGSHNSCLTNIGMSFVESWFLKILVSEKLLLKKGEIKNSSEIHRVMEIYEGDKDISISGTIKTGWLSSKKEFRISIPTQQFNEFLDMSFPLIGFDKVRFKEIKSKYLKYLSKKDQIELAD